MTAKRYLCALTLGGAMLAPAVRAWAETTAMPGATLFGSDLTATAAQPQPTPLDALAVSVPDDAAKAAPAAPSDAETRDTVKYLDAAAAEKPNIHGFAEAPFKTSYITPRGLVVEDQGLVFQPVAGFVLPIGDLGPIKDFAVITGVWNSINAHQNDPNVGPWNELDFFVSLTGKIANDFSVTWTYGMWNFPQSTPFKPKTEHNTDLKIAYDDTKFWGNVGNGSFGLHPYVDFFYALGGSSTVVLGKGDSTGYAEIGIVPTYTFKEITDYPITVTMPTYFSVGPDDYWGRGGTVNGIDASPSGPFGVFSSALMGSVPLSFIPTRYGYWHLDGGVTYFNLLNGTLFRAGQVGTGSGNRERNLFQGTIGIGVNF